MEGDMSIIYVQGMHIIEAVHIDEFVQHRAL